MDVRPNPTGEAEVDESWVELDSSTDEWSAEFVLLNAEPRQFERVGFLICEENMSFIVFKDGLMSYTDHGKAPNVSILPLRNFVRRHKVPDEEIHIIV